MIQEILNNSGSQWERQDPADPEAIRNLELNSKIDFPPEYLDFLKISNGGEGELGIDPYWFSIFSAEDVITYNNEYEVPEYIPGYCAFGSNLGGVLLIFKINEPNPKKVYYVDAVGMCEEDIVLVANTFTDFFMELGKESPEA